MDSLGEGISIPYEVFVGKYIHHLTLYRKEAGVPRLFISPVFADFGVGSRICG